MRIALDAMGTDDAPGSEVAGAVGALRDLRSDLEIVLVGDQGRIREELKRYEGVDLDRLRVEHARERIDPGESPALAVRRKPDSSIVVGLNLQKDGEADAFVSAGSTGAVMAASLLLLRPLPGVDRPAIGTLLPTASGACLMLDAGANVDCKPHHLVQFAHLGNIYAQDLMGRERPRVGLLNIGEEPEKGDELSVEAYRLLTESSVNFVGNIEGRELIQGPVDVLVCDGFVGNVLLKFYESVAEFIIGLLRRELEQIEEELELEDIFRILDYAEYGGAPLLGVNGVSIVCHGQSPPKAVQNAIGVAAQAVSSSMVSHIAGELSGATEGTGKVP
ncbi:MAG: phosphate acyltransferase PlsX [Gemmatimonadetes bacterium]|nr:phosphate acyltransferase PlsX [Gemmatimonadota bacterium]NIR79072.1 phosphate acyltransferase PlsX [Gemmatimonadota bacterium]NIT87727.1 phosphate acyltransferase PlsX [Gemmatimonadota bacterium]NIU31591.1 phosphate acyltransferase PlsX [Gemmatimonadota bacterium]NIU36235.1 phosphate acyltransferase PlsX [Gemmatimonadota bacterium]